MQKPFGQWVKERRKRLDLTREDLAMCVGCSLATIEKVETGERRASRQIAELLARCLRVPSGDTPAFVSFARGESQHILGAVPAALRSLADYPANDRAAIFDLPSPPTAFIGREREVEAACALLRREEVRLLTLIGPPGIGKTRLSLQVALGIAPHFDDDVYFIPLAQISDAALVTPAIARSLGVRESGSRPLLDVLKGKLKDKRRLLVLDNFEQVVQAGQVVSELLSAAPGLKVLVTSRVALRTYGEHSFPVPPMSLPDRSNTPSVHHLSEYEAIDLFVQRAQAAYPGFRLTNENAQAVTEICYRLDGLPLAIELAANRVTVLSAEKILARLEKSLDLLTGGALDLPPRQRTLRGAIDWSYTLLDPDEQALFRRLSIFSGGCTLEAAEEVAYGTTDDGRRTTDLPNTHPSPITHHDSALLDAMTSLVEKSLLRRDEVRAEPWFSMLETMREYAWEKLGLDEAEMGATVRSHAKYYLRLAEESEGELAGAQQGSWLERLEWEHDNFRAALNRALDRGDIETVARLSASLRRFWYLHAHMSEGRAWLKKAWHSAGSDFPQELRAKVLHGIGTLAWAQGDNSTAGHFFGQSLAIWRELGDERGIANMLNNLGIVALPQGDCDTAQAMHTESLALYRKLGDRWSIALALANLGLVALGRGDYEEAHSLLTDSLHLRQEMGDKQGIAQSFNNLGIVTRCMGKLEEAYGLHAQSLSMFEELGDRWSVALALVNMGFVALISDRERAQSLFKESLTLFIDLDARQGIATSLEGLAQVAVEENKMTHAATLFGAAEEIRKALGLPLPPDRFDSYNHSWTLARTALGDTQFDEAWEAGRAMPIEQICASALDE